MYVVWLRFMGFEIIMRVPFFLGHTTDDSELPRLLACPVPVVITSSGVAGRAPDLWSFDYLGKHLADVDNFFVLCAPLESKGRFGYYDLTGNKNPCGSASHLCATFEASSLWSWSFCFWLRCRFES